MAKEKKAPKARVRQLTIHSKFFGRAYQRFAAFPEIRLCGKWLQDIGFNCGEAVTVQQQKNKIIITINKPKQKNEICCIYKAVEQMLTLFAADGTFIQEG